MKKNPPKFIQIHSLTPMNNVLVNRDDTGQAKRTTMGGKQHVRISSQCLKKHWRDYNGPFSINEISEDLASVRSRLSVRELLIPEIKGKYDKKVVEAATKVFTSTLHSSKDGKKAQLILLGKPEISYLRGQVVEAAEEIQRVLKQQKPDDELDKKEKAEQDKKFSKFVEELIKKHKTNLAVMREQTKLPAGLGGAIFGRMVTADKKANIDAALHVAHSITTHSEETEIDYFSAVDDLQSGDVKWDENDDSLESKSGGAGHVSETEITSNLFYGYATLDVNTLIENSSGDRKIAAEVARRLVRIIGEVMPRAKSGSTAPYSRSSFMMVCAGERQPQSYADAYRDPCKPLLDDALQALEAEVKSYDEAYGIDDDRKYMTISNRGIDVGAARVNVPELAEWVGDLIENGKSQ